MEIIIYGDPYLCREFIKSKKALYEHPVELSEFDPDVCYTESLFDFGQQRGVFVELPQLKKNELLEKYMKEPSATCDLYLYITSKPDERLKVFKAFKERKNFPKLSQGELRKFLGERGVSAEVAEELGIRTGYLSNPDTDLYTIMTEVERLSHLENGLTVEGVREYVRSDDADVMSVCSRLDAPDILKRVQVITNRKGFEGMRMLGLLSSTFEKAYRRGHGEQTGYFRLDGEWSDAQLLQALEVSNDCARAIRSGELDDKQAFYVACAKIVGARRGA